MFSELIGIVEEIQDEQLKRLMLDVVNDSEVKVRLLSAPAAKTIHHAYVGGLLEHILSICGVMKFLGSHYNFLNQDLLYFGAIFHDIGKTWELDFKEGIQYTDKGRLVGHMNIACELVDRFSAKILGFKEDMKDTLKHIILSHHGRLEYGSPKRPKFLEALVVAMIDDLDSKLNTISQFMINELPSGESWSRYSQQFDRYFYLDFLRKKLDSEQ
jgi:3'-5' exoribonuclease